MVTAPNIGEMPVINSVKAPAPNHLVVRKKLTEMGAEVDRALLRTI